MTLADELMAIPATVKGRVYLSETETGGVPPAERREEGSSRPCTRNKELQNARLYVQV